MRGEVGRWRRGAQLEGEQKRKLTECMQGAERKGD